VCCDAWGGDYRERKKLIFLIYLSINLKNSNIMKAYNGPDGYGTKLYELMKKNDDVMQETIWRTNINFIPLITSGGSQTRTTIISPDGIPTSNLWEAETLFGCGPKLAGFTLEKGVIIVPISSGKNCDDIIKNLGKTDTLEILQLVFFNGYKSSKELYVYYGELITQGYDECVGIFDDKGDLVIDKFYPL
jgi:hypothetical protein